MRLALGAILVVIAALGCSALQLQLPLGGSGPSSNNRKDTRVNSRTLTGTVMDKTGEPVENAIVYLKNTRTLAVKTYIADNNGVYRFPELSPNVDYEVYAQRADKKSDTKTVSAFDDRATLRINLKLDKKK